MIEKLLNGLYDYLYSFMHIYIYYLFGHLLFWAVFPGIKLKSILDDSILFWIMFHT